MIALGTKVIIKKCSDASQIGKQGHIEGLAPDVNDTTIYKVKIDEAILPGWFNETDLEVSN